MRYRKPEELKETDVDWIDKVPKGWDYAPIKWFVKTMNGYAFSSSDYLDKNDENGVPIIRIGDIQNGGIALSDLRRLPNDFLKKHKEYQLLKNDLLIAMSGATVGKVGKYDLNGKGLLNQRVGCLRANKGVIPEYLWYVMNSDQFENYIQFYARGGAQPNISDSVIINFPGSIPPKPEQRSIAAFLDRKAEAIDGLIQKKEQLIERLKEKRQALITRAVTKGLDPDVPMKDSGIEWLGEIPEHWETKKLKYIKNQKKNSFVDGPFGSSLKSKHFVKNGDAYVVESNFATTGRISQDSLKQITEEHFEEIRRSECKGGDIIIAKIGAQYGLSNILPKLDKPAVVSGNSLKLTVNQEVANTKFVHQALLNIKWSGSLSVVVNTTAQPALSLSIMNNIEIAVPPKDEQLEIVNYLKSKKERYGAMTSKLKYQINKLKEYRQSLISAAVTGKIDVRNEVEVESQKTMA